MKHFLASVLLSAGAVAGCLAPSGGDPSTEEPPAGSFAASLLESAPPIEWDVAAQVDWWEEVATDYPKHDSNLPTNAQLRQRIVDDMEALGFDVEVRSYPGEVQGQGTDLVPGTELYAVIATKPGTEAPERRIGLVSHYDSQTGTIQGAYDDMSGVAAEYSICKALAEVPLDRTLACIFFDGEERGLVASREYVQDVVVEGDEPYTYDFVLGYDMTGINWPGHDWKLYAMAGQLWTFPDGRGAEPELLTSPVYPFARELFHEVLGYPEEGVEVLDDSDRNSDERRFKEAGVPILRFAGGRNAADYPMYHRPGDLVEYVYLYVDGRPNFEAGFATVVEASYAAILALDRTSLEELGRAYP